MDFLSLFFYQFFLQKKFLLDFLCKLKVSSIFGENGGKSNYREFPLKGQNVFDKKEVFLTMGVGGR